MAHASHFGHDRSKCSAVSSLLPQCGQVRDVIWPRKAWWKAVEVNLFNLPNYIVRGAYSSLWEPISELVGGLLFVPGTEHNLFIFISKLPGFSTDNSESSTVSVFSFNVNPHDNLIIPNPVLSNFTSCPLSPAMSHCSYFSLLTFYTTCTYKYKFGRVCLSKTCKPVMH